MRRLAATLLFGVAACASGSQTNATPSPVATPSDHVLMLVADECTGLASVPDCANARIACAKARELLDAAKVPATDKQRLAVTAAAGRCSVDPR